jgi:hypothetical protein
LPACRGRISTLSSEYRVWLCNDTPDRKRRETQGSLQRNWEVVLARIKIESIGLLAVGSL